MNPNVVGLGVLSIVWCTFSLACGGPDTPSTVADKASSSSLPARSAPPIETMLVTASPAAASLTLSARLTFAENMFAKVSSPLAGRVLEVRVKLGQPVKSGDVLLVMDAPDIATAYSDYVKEISELALAKRNYELALDLFQDKAVPLKELKQAENDFTREKAEFRQAKERLLTLRVPAAELDKPLEEQTINSRFELKSPLTGTVVERSVTPGQLVGNEPAQVLFTVADLDHLQAVVDVYERDLALITVGQEATATVEAWPGERFPAVIARIGDVVDPITRTIKVRAGISNGERKLKPEMFARLTIPMGNKTSFILIPQEAVLVVDGASRVYVEATPGRFVPREIKVQPVSIDQVRVLEGLTAGEHIVARGAAFQQTAEPHS
ncbi:MAG TPA: efflux RND transporter periplasmic adaptor subunit [Nitrospiraceae bacterium]|nr:efflux RND transporter periplasmic adaptor subunit [Nitrospiraceae bacterium]